MGTASEQHRATSLAPSLEECITYLPISVVLSAYRTIADTVASDNGYLVSICHASDCEKQGNMTYV